jgi:hypothetical protein
VGDLIVGQLSRALVLDRLGQFIAARELSLAFRVGIGAAIDEARSGTDSSNAAQALASVIHRRCGSITVFLSASVLKYQSRCAGRFTGASA